MNVVRRLVLVVLAGVLALGVGVANAADPVTPETYGDAMRWYRTEAESGYPLAQYLFGYMHEIGHGATRDAAIARDWYARAAAQGEPRAQYRLAGLYHRGQGGPPDLAEAVRWYRAAAERNHAGAQSMLGYLFAAGEGVARDDVQAYLWLTLAAEGGDTGAADNLERLTPGLAPEQIAAGKALIEAWSPAQIER